TGSGKRSPDRVVPGGGQKSAGNERPAGCSQCIFPPLGRNKATKRKIGNGSGGVFSRWLTMQAARDTLGSGQWLSTGGLGLRIIGFNSKAAPAAIADALRTSKPRVHPCHTFRWPHSVTRQIAKRIRASRRSEPD